MKRLLNHFRYWRMAMAAYRSGDYQSALVALERALEVHPAPSEDAEAFRATLLILNHRSGDAAEVLRCLTAGNFRVTSRKLSNYVRAYADYYLALIDHDSAADELRLVAIRLSPNNRFARLYLDLPNTRVK